MSSGYSKKKKSIKYEATSSLVSWIRDSALVNVERRIDAIRIMAHIIQQTLLKQGGNDIQGICV